MLRILRTKYWIFDNAYVDGEVKVKDHFHHSHIK